MTISVDMTPKEFVELINHFTGEEKIAVTHSMYVNAVKMARDMGNVLKKNGLSDSERIERIAAVFGKYDVKCRIGNGEGE